MRATHLNCSFPSPTLNIFMGCSLRRAPWSYGLDGPMSRGGRPVSGAPGREPSHVRSELSQWGHPTCQQERKMKRQRKGREKNGNKQGRETASASRPLVALERLWLSCGHVRTHMLPWDSSFTFFHFPYSCVHLLTSSMRILCSQENAFYRKQKAWVAIDV